MEALVTILEFHRGMEFTPVKAQSPLSLYFLCGVIRKTQQSILYLNDNSSTMFISLHETWLCELEKCHHRRWKEQ